VIFLLGGARSGKSATAVRLAAASGLPVTFIATAEAGDEEMASRIREHRAARPAEWTTVEASSDLVAAVTRADSAHFLVIDCLTLWVSTLMGLGRISEEVVGEAIRVADLVRERQAIVVSNEVGLGIVPANELARRYRDLLGRVNASFAAQASRTLLMVAGRALNLSPVDSLVNLK
jgi:adenosyl cobinamide kinase/adenosyl cobinamide phosphate guanylyltransferase